MLYAQALYLNEGHPFLFVGDGAIRSVVGGQQGYLHGLLLFSLVLYDVLRVLVPQVVKMFYCDDG